MILKLGQTYNKKDLKKHKVLHVFDGKNYINVTKWINYSDAPAMEVDFLGKNLCYIGHEEIK